MTDLILLSASVIIFCTALVALCGLSHFIIEEWRKSHARHVADKDRRIKRDREEIISAFMDLARERLVKGRAR